MNSKFWFIIVLLLSITQLVFAQQTQQQLADSVRSSFDQFSGQERMEKIADFIRFANFHKINHEPFKPYLTELYIWEKEHPDTRLLNTIRMGHVNMLIAENDHIEATKLMYNILHSGESLPVKDSVSLYTFLYGIYSGVNAYSKAWEVLRIRNNILTNHILNDPFFDDFMDVKESDLALIYMRTKQYEKAVKQFRLFTEQSALANKTRHEASAWNNLAQMYLEMHEPDSAIISLEKALKTWDEYRVESGGTLPASDTTFKYMMHGNIGAAYNQKGQYQEAIPLLKEFLKISQQTNDFSSVVNALNELSASYIGLNNPEKALELVDSTSKTLKFYPFVQGIRNSTTTKIAALEELGQNKKALYLMRQHIAFEDSVVKIEDKARVVFLEIEYEVEKKNSEIARQKIVLAEANAEKERRNGVLLSFFIGLPLLIIVVAILVVSRINRSKRAKKLTEKNEQIEHQHDVIEQSLSEKETLLKEIHHRVKNNLQLVMGILELQAGKFKDERIRDYLLEGQNRLKSMALIHQQLYESGDLGSIDFEDYVLKLTNDIGAVFNNKNKQVDIHLEANNISFDVNTAVPLGLIINELITNSFKHAFKEKEQGNIFIKVNERGNQEYELSVRDDGRGFPKGFDHTESRSLGMKLVYGLTRQLDGKCRIENGIGTTVIIDFKTENV